MSKKLSQLDLVLLDMDQKIDELKQKIDAVQMAKQVVLAQQAKTPKRKALARGQTTGDPHDARTASQPEVA